VFAIDAFGMSSLQATLGCKLSDGTEVLAPNKEHFLQRGRIDDIAAAELELPKDYRVVNFEKSGKAFALPEGRLVPWEGYAARVLETDEEKEGHDSTSAQLDGEASAPKAISIWRCEIWTEGLFSLLFWALGWMEAESCSQPTSAVHQTFVIDWTDSRILFHTSHSPRCANVWNSFFHQPCEFAADVNLSSHSLILSEQQSSLTVTVRFGPPWFHKFGEFRGADEGDSKHKEIKGGRLDEAAASSGRHAMKRWIRVREAILERASEIYTKALADCPNSRLLAVHIRRTDKLQQCKSNCIERESLVTQICGFCRGLECSGVFVCTDDADLKSDLQHDLRALGVQVAVHRALLSQGNQPSHKDERLDRRHNATDVLLEALVMSKCSGLLSTYSNVSVAAVYFSQPGYSYFMFGDAPPVHLSSGSQPQLLHSTGLQRRCAGCGAHEPPLCCSRCKSAFFCSRRCQQQAWRSHKPKCVACTG